MTRFLPTLISRGVCKPLAVCLSPPQTSRMYTVPLYEDLVAGVMKCVAVEIYYQTQRRLHPNLRRTLQLILFPSSSPATNQSGPVATAGSSPSGSPLQTPTAMALRDVNVSAWQPSGPPRWFTRGTVSTLDCRFLLILPSGRGRIWTWTESEPDLHHENVPTVLNSPPIQSDPQGTGLTHRHNKAEVSNESRANETVNL